MSDPASLLQPSATKKWLSKKTSGIGYTMALYKSGLGASVLVSLSPFFLGLSGAPLSSLGNAQLLVDGSNTVTASAAPGMPAAGPTQPTVVEGPTPLSPSEPRVEGALGKKVEEEEDEIPVPVLANGQQQDGGAEGGDAGRQPEGCAGDAARSGKDDQEEGTGGGLQEEAAGANTVGVA